MKTANVQSACMRQHFSKFLDRTLVCIVFLKGKVLVPWSIIKPDNDLTFGELFVKINKVASYNFL